MRVNVCETVRFFGGISSVQWRQVRANVILSYIVCSNRNSSALVRELLSNDSMFVGQLYEINYSRCALVI